MQSPSNFGLSKCSVTILTGFLGSGKTTLLNRILTDKTLGKRFAVIENEFSLEIGIEKELVANADELEGNFTELFEFGNGCICCSSRGDFERILRELMDNRLEKHKKGEPLPFDYLIVETTGLADPIFIKSFLDDDEFSDHFQLDGIITLVDAKHIVNHLSNTSSRKNEAIEQLLYADRIILNKTDLILEEAEIAAVEKEIRNYNKSADIYRSTFSKLDLSLVLDINAFDIQNVERIWKDDNRTISNLHNPDVGAVVLIGQNEVEEDRFRNWLQSTLDKHSKQIYRIKGLLALKGKKEQFILQGVHEHFSMTTHLSGKTWDKEEKRVTKVVFIGKDLPKDEILNSFKESLSIDAFCL